MQAQIEGREIHAFVGGFHAAVGNVVVVEPAVGLPLMIDFVINIGVQHGPKTKGQAEKEVCGVVLLIVHF